MPYLVPYSAGVRFLTSHIEWVLSEIAKNKSQALTDGQRIGKMHTLHFVASSAKSARVSSTKILVPLSGSEQWSDAAVQVRAIKAAERALRHEAEIVLPPRLQDLAKTHGIDYASVRVKKLKSRWGSCDSHKNIVLNLYLMQLPFELIDYVLCHELAHTKHMDHSAAFWSYLDSLVPNAKKLRAQLKPYKTSL